MVQILILNIMPKRVILWLDRKLTFPDFSPSGSVLKVCNEAKYLGNYITDDLSDDRDMYRQCCTLYVQYVDSQIWYMLRICEDNTF